jgi:succinate dehydrogenase/fumarate reductase flavoprotein subunit
MLPIDDLTADVLILGAGGAGMLAALHVTTANPRARIVIAVKGLIGQSGCTRMVQGDYSQSSACNPSTRENSPMLLVTRVNPWTVQIAVICRS